MSVKDRKQHAFDRQRHLQEPGNFVVAKLIYSDRPEIAQRPKQSRAA